MGKRKKPEKSMQELVGNLENNPDYLPISIEKFEDILGKILRVPKQHKEIANSFKTHKNEGSDNPSNNTSRGHSEK